MFRKRRGQEARAALAAWDMAALGAVNRKNASKSASGLPDHEQGLATGLTTMTQNIAITIGLPILSAVAATRTSELDGIHLALTVNVAFTLASAALVWIGLRPRTEHGADTSAAAVADKVQAH